MKILSDEQRAKLLKVLEGAPDQVLCDAVVEVKRFRLQVQDTYKECTGYIGRDEVRMKTDVPAVEIDVKKYAADAQADAKPQTKPQTPPGVACSRVGTDTKDQIKARCMKPSTAAEINTFLKRGTSKLADTTNILKLLWDRGELVYEDGTYRNK